MRETRATFGLALNRVGVILAIITVLGFALGFQSARAQSVTLIWNADADTNVVSYIVYASTDGVHFDAGTDSQGQTNFVSASLEAGTSNYFEVSAYDASGNMSVPSGPIQFIVPGTVASTVTVQPPDVETNTAIVPAATTATVTNTPVVTNAPIAANRVAGTSNGLFYVADQVANETSGSVTASVSKSGSYTAKIRMASHSYTFAGSLAADGSAVKTIKRAGQSSLTVQFQFNATNGPVTGSVTDGTWTASLLADQSVYSAANPAPQAGKYTMIIPGSTNSASQPAGNGFASITVSKAGLVSVSGVLADGTALTAATVISGEGQFPLYASAYAGKGSVFGWLTITNDSVTGQVAWIKLAESNAKLYPAGFTNGADVVGSVYRNTNGAAILGFTNGELVLTGADVNVTGAVTLDSARHETTTRLSFKTLSGLFVGSVVNPETGKPVAVEGAVLQNQNIGAGYFLNANQSGSVVLAPIQ